MLGIPSLLVTRSVNEYGTDETRHVRSLGSPELALNIDQPHCHTAFGSSDSESDENSSKRSPYRSFDYPLVVSKSAYRQSIFPMKPFGGSPSSQFVTRIGSSHPFGFQKSVFCIKLGYL